MMSMPDRDSLIEVGHIHTPYGIKGWVWVVSHTQPMTNVFNYGPWYLHQNDQFTAVKVQAHRPQGKGIVALLDVCPDRTAAEALRGTKIWVPKSSLPSLEPDEYYWSELIDMQVITERQELLGTIHAMMETGANDVIVVRPCEGSIDSQERLLPWLPGRVVRFVDRVQRRITVDWDPSY